MDNDRRQWSTVNGTGIIGVDGLLSWDWADDKPYSDPVDALLLIRHKDYPGVNFTVRWNRLHGGFSTTQIVTHRKWVLVLQRIHAKMAATGTKTAVDAATKEKEGTEDAPQD